MHGQNYDDFVFVTNTLQRKCSQDFFTPANRCLTAFKYDFPCG